MPNYSPAPVILFVYNRPEHTKKTIEALKKNNLAAKSELFIFSDAAKNESSEKQVDAVREYLETLKGFKVIHILKRERNYGLAASIIDGVSSILAQYGKVIVLEDDLLTSPLFLQYMNEALDLYQTRKDIFSITGFSFSTKFMQFPEDFQQDIYLNIRPMSWSWATWSDRWKNIDWEVKDFEKFLQDKEEQKLFNKGGTDLTRMLKKQMQGKVNSWYIRWTYHSIMKQKAYTVYPRISLVNNIGHDASGVHCQDDPNDVYSHTELNMLETIVFPKQIELDVRIVQNFNKGFNTDYWRILKRKANSLMKKLK